MGRGGHRSPLAFPISVCSAAQSRNPAVGQPHGLTTRVDLTLRRAHLSPERDCQRISPTHALLHVQRWSGRLRASPLPPPALAAEASGGCLVQPPPPRIHPVSPLLVTNQWSVCVCVGGCMCGVWGELYGGHVCVCLRACVHVRMCVWWGHVCGVWVLTRSQTNLEQRLSNTSLSRTPLPRAQLRSLCRSRCGAFAVGPRGPGGPGGEKSRSRLSFHALSPPFPKNFPNLLPSSG